MRVLNMDNLVEMLDKYAQNDDLRGCIVLSNGEKRRSLKNTITRYILCDGLHIAGNVIMFRSRSLITLAVAADRHGSQMYDDILVDEEINDYELLFALDRAEYFKEESDYGVFKPLSEIKVAAVDPLKMKHEIILDEFILSDVDARDYYIHVKNGSAMYVTSKAPDLGEFAPSQELQNFLNDLV